MATPEDKDDSQKGWRNVMDIEKGLKIAGEVIGCIISIVTIIKK